MKGKDLFFELIQVAVGTREHLSRVPSEDEWQLIYDTTMKQCMMGVVFSAVERLNEKDSAIKPPEMLFYDWLGEVTQIERQNAELNEVAALVYRNFKNNGFRSCILKGQGVARLYNANDNDNDNANANHNHNDGDKEGGMLERRREPGDIDIWVEGERDEILAFLKENHLKTKKIVIHHVDVSLVEGVETEVHFQPSYTYDFLRYKKYKKFFKEEANIQFEHFDEQVGFAYPTNRFNAVYLMMHIFHHVFHEGIGLRQLMDYYFVLVHLTDEERMWAAGILKWLGLEKVTAAVMHVMKAAFQIGDKYLLFSPLEETGECLLEDIFEGGNFGKFGEHYEDAHSGNGFNRYLKHLQYLKRLYSLCPSEVLWAPIWKPSHWCWRKWKGYLK